MEYSWDYIIIYELITKGRVNMATHIQNMENNNPIFSSSEIIGLCSGQFDCKLFEILLSILFFPKK